MRAAIEADPSLRGMGSTLVAAMFFEDRFQWLSVGDSHSDGIETLSDEEIAAICGDYDPAAVRGLEVRRDA